MPRHVCLRCIAIAPRAPLQYQKGRKVVSSWGQPVAGGAPEEQRGYEGCLGTILELATEWTCPPDLLSACCFTSEAMYCTSRENTEMTVLESQD